jgi:tetratricopeptide (TPR) repeat protein/predicted Ser/Thr protein kinase
MEQVAETKRRWERLETLFHCATEFPEAERATKAREWCGDDLDLLTELLNMLASDSSVEELIASSPVAESDALLHRDFPGVDSEDRWIGTDLGPFRLERLLGRGGMGMVYLAHRTSTEFRQTVAIKLIARHLKSEPAVQQFNRERDALARLDHKNIARLIDAGVTADGTPYVAMEYIEGKPFNELCDDPQLPLEQKLKLFLQLCDAVAYVHRNLILHRDLKPGNVMVTGEGVVKLLDFGTLKLLGPAAELSSEMTQAGMRPMTLRYASPEHIEGVALSTAADVYSLGMILYRIVASRLPELPNELSLYEHVERLKNAGMPAPSRLRGGKRNSMDRDLDAIVLKATRFEPGKRYLSADALASDIRLCLQLRPVGARRGSTRYRATRFFARNRRQVLVMATVLVVLAVGLAWMEREAAIARRDQQQAAQGIEQERSLAHFIFKDYFQELRDIPGSTAAQRAAVSQALSYLDRLSKVADSEGLRLDTIEAYRRMSLLQGDPYEQNLGDPQGALKSLAQAQQLSTSLSKTAKSPEVLSTLALLARTHSEVLYGIGKTQDAVAEMRSAVSLYDVIAANPSVTTAQLQFASNAYNGLADELGQPDSSSLGDTKDALVAYHHDIELSQRALKIDPKSSLSRQSIAVAHNKIGQLLVSTDPRAAIDSFRHSIVDRDLVPEKDRYTFRSKRGLAINLMDLGNALAAVREYEGAMPCFTQARDTFEQFVAADPKDVRAKHDLAVLLSEQGSAYVEELNPDLIQTSDGVRKDNLKDAIALFERSTDILEHIAATDAAPLPWRVLLAYDRVVLGSLRFKAHLDIGGRLTPEGLSQLRSFATVSNLSIEELSWITKGNLTAEPVKLRDPSLTKGYAERLTALDHRLDPRTLLLLAQAYDAAGNSEKSENTARQALKLLSSNHAGEKVPRTQKLLEMIARP